MNFKNILEQLINSGWTQQELAAECGCGQSTLADILSGRSTQPRAILGIKLISLAIAEQNPKPTEQGAING